MFVVILYILFLYIICCRQVIKKFLIQPCQVTTYFGNELRDLESMALLGKIEQYDPEQEEWPQYVERLEQFFEANDLTGDAKADKRLAIFLSVIGPAPYKLLRSLLAPAKPKEKKYDELVAKLTEHCTTVRHLPRSCNASVSTPGQDRLENL